jgi:hypothetical protein
VRGPTHASSCSKDPRSTNHAWRAAGSRSLVRKGHGTNSFPVTPRKVKSASNSPCSGPRVHLSTSSSSRLRQRERLRAASALGRKGTAASLGSRHLATKACVRLSDGIGIVQPLALAVATGGGGGGDYGITQGGKISVRL